MAPIHNKVISWQLIQKVDTVVCQVCLHWQFKQKRFSRIFSGCHCMLFGSYNDALHTTEAKPLTPLIFFFFIVVFGSFAFWKSAKILRNLLLWGSLWVKATQNMFFHAKTTVSRSPKEMRRCCLSLAVFCLYKRQIGAKVSFDSHSGCLLR